MRKSESAYGIEVSCDAKTPEGPNPLGFLRHSTDWKVFPTIGSLLSIQTYRYRVRCYNWLVHQIFFQLMLQIDPLPGDSAGPTHKTFHFSIQIVGCYCAILVAPGRCYQRSGTGVMDMSAIDGHESG